MILPFLELGVIAAIDNILSALPMLLAAEITSLLTFLLTLAFSRFCLPSKKFWKIQKNPQNLTALRVFVGGRYRTRTYDPLHVKQVL